MTVVLFGTSWADLCSQNLVPTPQTRLHGTVPISFPISASWSLAGFEHLCGCKHRPAGGKLTVWSVMVLVANSLLWGPLSQ